MSAYLIADIAISDPQAYEEYKRAASASIAQYGGRYLVRGGTHKVLEGQWQPTRLVVLEFPDMATLDAWYQSNEYALAVPHRLASATSDIVAVQGA